MAVETVSNAIEGVRAFFENNARRRRQVSFCIALIALAAKTAKADGIVTENEIKAFGEIFFVPEEEIKNVSRFYDLAKRDSAGYQAYAAQVKRLFPGAEEGDDEILRDVLDALFHIAKADGFVHEKELRVLEEIARIFGFDETAFARLRTRHIDGEAGDPYAILGADESWPFERLKKRYRERVAQSHPDRLIARGVPAEFVMIANERLAAVNAAWEQIERRRK